MLRSFLNSIKGLITKHSGAEATELTRIARGTTDSHHANIQSPLSSTQIESSSVTPISPTSINRISPQVSPNQSSTANMYQLGIKISETPKASTNQTQHFTEDNFVRVRIWTSKTRSGIDTFSASAVALGGNIGHASIETKKIYASIWPDWNSRIDAVSAKSDYRTLEQDKISEAMHDELAREADYIIDFYSLDVRKIEALFAKVEKDTNVWTLFGTSPEHKGFSCSGLTLHLLEEGGLNNLVSKTMRSIVSPTSNVVISPNNLINQLSLAKSLEETRFPQITEFKLQPITEGSLSKKESFLLTIKANKVNISNVSNNRQTNKTSENEAPENNNAPRSKLL